MSDNVLKCSCCGYNLEASSASQNRIKCPKCGAVNVISIPEKNRSTTDREITISGIQITADNDDIHNRFVSWIFKKHETAPPDIFSELTITGVKRLCVPCYLIECSAEIRYSYKIGNERERVRALSKDDFLAKNGKKDYVETYTEYTHQNDVYNLSTQILFPGNSELANNVKFIYESLDKSLLQDANSLNYPSDVQQVPLDITMSDIKDRAKENVGNIAQKNIKELLSRHTYKDLDIRNDFRVDFGEDPIQILLPLIHVTFTYKDQAGDAWLSGDAGNILVHKFPQNFTYKNALKDLQKQKPGFLNWLLVIASMSTIVLIPLGIYLIKNIIDKSKKVNEKINELKKDHNKIFFQYQQKKIPLKGVLQKGLQGCETAFPEPKLLRTLDLDVH
jgi:phage FluMu protein Com